MNFQESIKAKLNRGGRLILVAVAAFVMLAAEVFAQDYEISLNQRRMGDKIGVEVWIKSLNSGAPKLGNTSVAVTYDTTYLSPTDKATYDFAASDSVNYDVTGSDPYTTLASPFDNTNGYGELKAQAANIGSVFTYQLDIAIQVGSTDGMVPSEDGRGSLIGRLQFDIRNHDDIDNNTLTGIEINTSTLVGDLRIFDIDGNDMEANTNLTQPGDFAVRGITILNPDGPYEAVNRNKTYDFLGFAGYPVYFERSGMVNPYPGGTYGSNILAYAISYSVNNGSNWSDDVIRVAETRKTLSELTTASEEDWHYSGELETSTGTSAGYLVSQGDGTQLPVESSNYGGVLRIIWDDDPFFSPRSEEAKLRICQLDTTSRSADIDNRDEIGDEVCGISDDTFVLSRLFFLQLDGASKYLKTRDFYSNATQLTVEAWVNLNSYGADGTEPGIVATGPGAAEVNEEGAWILYLADGKYPAFRCLEIEGRGEDGSEYIAQVQSPDALSITSDDSPISDEHSTNWHHIAATVRNNVVKLYVDGELMASETNTQANNIRMDTKEHPVWVGANPTGGIGSDDYLHAGIKEVRVWRKALGQDTIRKNMAGVLNPEDADDEDIRSSLELYYDFVGTSSDLANDAIQNGTNPIWCFDDPAILAEALSTITFRPDRAHVRLTSPSTGSGVSNREDINFPVRWAAYGVGDYTTSGSDLVLEFSKDGTNWALAIDSTTPGGLLDDVEIEDPDGTVYWEPYKHAGVVGAYNELQSVDPTLGAVYTKSVTMRIRGTEANNQDDITYTTDSFNVAPFFSMRNTGESIVVVPGSSAMNVTGGAAFIESWIRPYRFPTTDEEYFPIINKTDSSANTGHYALNLLPTGQLQFNLTTATGGVLTATSDSSKPIIAPNVDEFDSAWIHVGVFMNLANGSGTSLVKFYIDGNPQSESEFTEQLGSDVTVNSTNEFPVFIAYEPGGTILDEDDEETSLPSKSFIGEVKGVRFWNGAPGGFSFSGNEPTDLTNFIRGELTVRADRLLTAYQENLVASFDMNGGGFFATDFPYYSSFSSFNGSDSLQAQIIVNNGIEYAGVKPYIKLVEPIFDQIVPNTTENLLVRWVGFDFDADGFSTGDAGKGVPSDLEYSTKGGGDIDFTPFNVTSSEYEGFDPNSFDLALTEEFKFQGTNPPLIPFGGSLDVSIANGNDATAPNGVPITATLRNAKLRFQGRSTINSASPLTFSSFRTLRDEGPLFTITPPSNFTVRVLLEGYHEGGVTGITGTIGTTFETNGIMVTLYNDNNGEPGTEQATGLSLQGYSQVDPLNPTPLEVDGSEFANVPLIFTTIDDGDYYVVVDHQNHLPIMSRFAAPFEFNGDDESSWEIESGWDFAGWDGDSDNVLAETDDYVNLTGQYTAYGFSQTDAGLTEYGATGLAYNDGQTSTTPTALALPAMVAGDVVSDGKINAADRVQVRVDAGAANSFESDVTGDGIINGVDRDIVDKNNNRTSSIADIFPTTEIENNYNPYNVTSEFNATLAMMMNESALEFDKNGKEQDSPYFKTSGSKVQSSGLDYKVTAEGELVEEDSFVNLSIYIENVGEEFAPGNCTFGIKYDPSVLTYESLNNIEGSIWSNIPDRGYIGKSFSAPGSNAPNPLPDVRTIEIDYDGYTRKLGNNVPYERSLIGTLRFKVRNLDKEIAFDWHRSTVVLRTDGLDITGEGKFDKIKKLNSVEEAEITVPNGGEIWRVNRLYTITWTIPSFDVPVRIELSADGGITWEGINQDPVSIFAGEYDWRTPVVSSTECLVRIVDMTSGIEIDRSDNVFSILPSSHFITRPSASDPAYTGGNVDLIMWSSDEPTTVRFEFSPNGADGWIPVSGEVNSQSGQVQWTVPLNVNTKQAVIAMIDVRSGEFLAVSEPFKVLAGELILTTPREASILEVAEKTAVRWTHNNNVKEFDLEFTPDGGLTWLNVDNDLNALKGTYTWSVPNVPYTEVAQLRALWNNDPDMEYSRSPIFTIDGSTSSETSDYIFSVEMPYPNPFDYETTIEFTIPESLPVYADVYNQAGLRVATLSNGMIYGAGNNRLALSGNDLPAGVYFVKVTAGVNTAIREVVLVK